MNGRAAILVDLDGTLVDTKAANAAAYTAALAEAGVTVPLLVVEATAHGRNWRQFLPELLAQAGSTADAAGVARRKAELYRGYLCLSVVNAGLVRLLEFSRPRCSTALVTTASAVNAGAVLRHHGLERLFDLVVTGDDVQHHKPAPDAYELAAVRLGVLPYECLVIEDSDIGVSSANAFGAVVIRVASSELPNPA